MQKCNVYSEVHNGECDQPMRMDDGRFNKCRLQAEPATTKCIFHSRMQANEKCAQFVKIDGGAPNIDIHAFGVIMDQYFEKVDRKMEHMNETITRIQQEIAHKQKAVKTLSDLLTQKNTDIINLKQALEETKQAVNTLDDEKSKDNETRIAALQAQIAHGFKGYEELKRNYDETLIKLNTAKSALAAAQSAVKRRYEATSLVDVDSYKLHSDDTRTKTRRVINGGEDVPTNSFNMNTQSRELSPQSQQAVFPAAGMERAIEYITEDDGD